MKHSDYMKITWGLENLMNSREFGIETLRVLFATVEVPAEPETLMPGERAIRRVPTDDAREHQFFQIRFQLLDKAEKIAEETADLIWCCTDKWMETNQDRADRRMKPTVHTMSLIPLMSNFLTATSTPIPGCVRLYDKVRNCCREWVRSANKWFPKILANQGGETKPAPQEPEPASTTEIGTIDRDKLAGLFKACFTRVEPNSGHCQFEVFYNELIKRANMFSYKPKDWGRVGYQVLNSGYIVGKKLLKPFKRWFEIVGVPTPGEPSPGAYKDNTEPTDFSKYL